MQFVGKIGAPIQAYIDRCKALDPVWAVSIMTLLGMVRYQGGAWYYHVIGPVILGVAALFPKIVYREQFWLLMGMVTGSSIVLDWTLLGNHSFMLFYWTLALLLASFSSDRLRFLAMSSRWLVAFLFLFAFVWKLNSNDFRNGATTRYLLSATYPAGYLSVVLAGMSNSQLEDNINGVKRVLSSTVTTQVKLNANAPVGRLADVMTISTLIIEGFTALIFLLPLSLRWLWLRDMSLILFMLTAYSIIPVASFATQLAYLGYAATNSNRTRATYIALFFIYQLSALVVGGGQGAI
jgi:hypothetical protein